MLFFFGNTHQNLGFALKKLLTNSATHDIIFCVVKVILGVFVLPKNVSFNLKLHRGVAQFAMTCFSKAMSACVWRNRTQYFFEYPYVQLNISFIGVWISLR